MHLAMIALLASLAASDSVGGAKLEQAPRIGLAASASGAQLLSGGDFLVGAGGLAFLEVPFFSVFQARVGIGGTPFTSTKVGGVSGIRTEADLTLALAPRFGSLQLFAGGGINGALRFTASDESLALELAPDFGIEAVGGLNVLLSDWLVLNGAITVPLVVPSTGFQDAAIFPRVSLGLAFQF